VKEGNSISEEESSRRKLGNITDVKALARGYRLKSGAKCGA